jgi:hypothetical protein
MKFLLTKLYLRVTLRDVPMLRAVFVRLFAKTLTALNVYSLHLRPLLSVKDYIEAPRANKDFWRHI